MRDGVAASRASSSEALPAAHEELRRGVANLSETRSTYSIQRDARGPVPVVGIVGHAVEHVAHVCNVTARRGPCDSTDMIHALNIDVPPCLTASAKAKTWRRDVGTRHFANFLKRQQLGVARSGDGVQVPGLGTWQTN